VFYKSDDISFGMSLSCSNCWSKIKPNVARFELYSTTFSIQRLVFQGTVDVNANIDFLLQGFLDYHYSKQVTVLNKRPIPGLGLSFTLGSVTVALGATFQIDAIFTAVRCCLVNCFVFEVMNDISHQDLSVSVNVTTGIDITGKAGAIVMCGADFSTPQFDRNSLNAFTYNTHPMDGHMDASTGFVCFHISFHFWF
jgi:hypothetical protein